MSVKAPAGNTTPTPATEPPMPNGSRTMGRRDALLATGTGIAAGFFGGAGMAHAVFPVDAALDAYQGTGDYKCSGDQELNLSPRAALARRIVKQGHAMDVGTSQRNGVGLGGAILATVAAGSTFQGKQTRRRGALSTLLGLWGGCGLGSWTGTPAQQDYQREVYAAKVEPALRALNRLDPTGEIRAWDDVYFANDPNRDPDDSRELRLLLTRTYEDLAVSMRFTDPDISKRLVELRTVGARSQKKPAER